MQLSTFQKIGEIVLSSKKRKEAEYVEFFKFFRALVETTDSEVAKAIGRTAVTVILSNGETKDYGIELTPTDYLWWKEKTATGLRFKYSMEAIRSAILGSMTKAAESNKMTADERKQILALLDEAPQ